MKAPRGCSPCDGGTLQRQVMPMDLDVYWCDGSVWERWKQDVPSTITRSINGIDSQNRSRTKDLDRYIINNQHPIKRRTIKGRTVIGFPVTVERITHSGSEPGNPVSVTVIPVFVPGAVRAVRRLLGRKTPKSTAMQWIYPRRLNSTGVSKATKRRTLATRLSLCHDERSRSLHW